MRIPVGSIGTGVVAYPIRTAKHVVVAGWIGNAGNVATARANAIRVILVVSSRAGDDALQYAVIVEAKREGPGASAHTGVGEGILIESCAICGAGARKVVIACGGVADADSVDHHLIGGAASAI